MLQNTKQKGSIWVAISIIIAGALVAGAVIFTDEKNAENNPLVKNNEPEQIQDEPTLDSVVAIGDSDYYRGNPNATIKIVEYSDTECPFCERLHMTLKELLKQYPNDVMWVYRHMPIPSLHPNAMKEAIASECAGVQRGNDGFWAMLDRIYEDDSSATSLSKFASEQGLNVEEFNSCLNSKDVVEKIKNQTEQAYNAGGQGTPFSVVFVPDGEKVSVPGAQPLNVWQNLVESFITTEAEGSSTEN